MRRERAGTDDSFRKMLLWSGVGHLVLFVLIATASKLGAQKPGLPVPDAVWVVGGPAAPGEGAGAAPSTKPPAPKPKPEEREPRVVRPTKEERDQLPLPDAKPARGKPTPPKPPSGLVGKDAASAPSAQLKEEGGMGGLGLGASGGSPFDSPFEYDYYVFQMLAKIRSHWTRHPVRGTVTVQMGFTILRDGHLEDIVVEKSSGVELLDRAAERALYLSDPLPPLPNTYPRDRVGVHLLFEYSDRY